VLDTIMKLIAAGYSIRPLLGNHENYLSTLSETLKDMIVGACTVLRLLWLVST